MRSGLYVLRYSHFFEVLVIARCPFDLSSCFMYLLHSCRSYHSTGWNSKADYWWKVNHAISWLQIFSSSFDLICQYLQCSYEINLLALFKLWYLQQVVRYLCDFWVGPHILWHAKGLAAQNLNVQRYCVCHVESSAYRAVTGFVWWTQRGRVDHHIAITSISCPYFPWVSCWLLKNVIGSETWTCNDAYR